jgi:hypothetical protein
MDFEIIQNSCLFGYGGLSNASHWKPQQSKNRTKMKQHNGVLALLVSMGTILPFPAVAQSSLASASNEITPFELVYRGYQRRYHAQGIGGFGTFLQEVRWGRIKASKLVAAAIAAGDLPATASQDSEYLKRVENQLWSISR